MQIASPTAAARPKVAISSEIVIAPERAAMWRRVDEIVAQAPDVPALRRHRLHLLAARSLRQAGLPVHPELAEAERIAALKVIGVRYVLNRIRAVVDGPLVLMKGVEAAASYRVPECRPFRDVDIIVPDAEAAHAALVADGFVVLDIGPTEFHLRPLALPGTPLIIELHHGAPHWSLGLDVPSTDELLALSTPSRTGVAGFRAMEPSAHAVLLAVHAWAHGPLERIGQLIDVAAVLGDGDREEADRVARAWGCERLWNTTTAAIGSLLGDERESLAVRVWARHLRTAREPRVLESYLTRLAAPMWGMPRDRVARGIWEELCRTALPDKHETWGDQLWHLARALARVGRPLSQFRT